MSVPDKIKYKGATYVKASEIHADYESRLYEIGRQLQPIAEEVRKLYVDSPSTYSDSGGFSARDPVAFAVLSLLYRAQNLAQMVPLSKTHESTLQERLDKADAALYKQREERAPEDWGS